MANLHTGSKINKSADIRPSQRGWSRSEKAAAISMIALMGAGIGIGAHNSRSAEAKQEKPQGPKYYQVQKNDTLTGIVHKGYPNLELYSQKFNDKVNELRLELSPNDQTLGELHPEWGETLTLSPDAQIGTATMPEGGELPSQHDK